MDVGPTRSRSCASAPEKAERERDEGDPRRTRRAAGHLDRGCAADGRRARNTGTTAYEHGPEHQGRGVRIPSRAHAAKAKP